MTDACVGSQAPRTGTTLPMATLDEVLAGITLPPESARCDGHSQTYEFLWRAYEVLTPHLDPPRRPSWLAVAQRLAAKGVRDGEGKPPTAERVRKAWWKVTRDRGRIAAGVIPGRRGRKPASPSATAPLPVAPQPPATPPKRRAGSPGPQEGDDEFSDFFAIPQLVKKGMTSGR
jgi:hypothetical protein